MRIFTHQHTLVTSKADSTHSSSSLATINHYHHHYRDRRHRAEATWTDSHAIHARGNTERDAIFSSSLAANYSPQTASFWIPTPTFACISPFSSSSFSTHPAICVPYLSRILDSHPSIPWTVSRIPLYLIMRERKLRDRPF